MKKESPGPHSADPILRRRHWVNEMHGAEVEMDTIRVDIVSKLSDLENAAMRHANAMAALIVLDQWQGVED